MDGGNPLVVIDTAQLLLTINFTCGADTRMECRRCTIALRSVSFSPVWRCSTWTLVAGSSAPHVEHLHWECRAIPVLLSGMSCTISVVSVVTVAATTTVFTHWAPPPCNGGCWPPQQQRVGHQCRSMLWNGALHLWRGGPLVCGGRVWSCCPIITTTWSTVSTSMVVVMCVPMNNTFSLCPQVSDTVLSQYSPPSSE